MIRNLFYHFFWNFYDYLGSYLLLGTLVTGAMLGTAWLASLAAAQLAAPVPRITLMVMAGTLLAAIKLGGVAGLFAFADKAARDEAARLPDFRKGVRDLLAQYLKVALLTLVIAGIATVDIAAYWRMGISARAGFLRSAFGILAMVLLWAAIAFYVYIFPLAAAPARFAEAKSIKTYLRKSFVLFSLYPMFWVATALLYAVLLIGCIVSVVGIIFLLPLFASLSTTAFDIALRRTEFLTQAREELGAGVGISAYRRRAGDLAFEWEARQPKRTFRELIKPWEA